jgi:hypothetical protein
MRHEMSKEFLSDRRTALDESFFAKQNEALRQRLRKAEEDKPRKDALSAASGITDDVVLERLVALNIGRETLPALFLAPLVAVAWADGYIDDKERNAVLSGAAELGLSEQEASYQLLERWLGDRPTPELLSNWKEYISALSVRLSQHALERLRPELLQRARAVAEAGGARFGTGQRISSPEQAVLEELETAISW